MKKSLFKARLPMIRFAGRPHYGPSRIQLPKEDGSACKPTIQFGDAYHSPRPAFRSVGRKVVSFAWTLRAVFLTAFFTKESPYAS